MEIEKKIPNCEITEESTFMYRCDEARRVAFEEMLRKYEIRTSFIK